VRFERRRQEVRDRGPGRADDGGGIPLASDAEGGEPRDALVDAHVHGCRAARLELGGDEASACEREPGLTTTCRTPSSTSRPRRRRRHPSRGCRVGACHVRRAVRVARADRRRPQEAREARAAGRGVFQVEGGEFRLEATDALVLIADRPDRAEEGRVVVGGLRDDRRRARPRPTTNHRMPPSTGSSTTMSSQTGLLTPRWRVGGSSAQSTML
jgi:hypothetical protein